MYAIIHHLVRLYYNVESAVFHRYLSGIYCMNTVLDSIGVYRYRYGIPVPGIAIIILVVYIIIGMTYIAGIPVPGITRSRAARAPAGAPPGECRPHARPSG